MENSIPQTIRTVAGIAYYQCTEVENQEGRWNNNYSTRDGFWVIHRGRFHDVYSVNAKPLSLPQGEKQ